jgi:uncharacterized protein YgbK (DUF1537 family)
MLAKPGDCRSCLLFKSCSTFDSAEKGNIGPMADALGEDFTIACPSLWPDNFMVEISKAELDFSI